MMTLHLAKGEGSNADNKTIRDDGTGHEMVERGHSWLRVGNNMSAIRRGEKGHGNRCIFVLER